MITEITRSSIEPHPVSDELYRVFLKTFQNFQDPVALTESPLLARPFVQQTLQKEQGAIPYQTLKLVFTEILELLAKENPEYADLLHGRFWEGKQVEEMLAAERPLVMSRRTFANYQRNAIQTFAFLFLQAEMGCLQKQENLLNKPNINQREPKPQPLRPQPVPTGPQDTRSRRRAAIPYARLAVSMGVIVLVTGIATILLLRNFLDTTTAQQATALSLLHTAAVMNDSPLSHATKTRSATTALGAEPILFEDDFEAGAGKWRADSTAWTVRSDARGNQQYCVRAEGDYTYALTGSTNWRDYKIEMDLQILSSAKGGSGNLLWRVGEELLPFYEMDFFANAEGGATLAKEAPDYMVLDQSLRGFTEQEWLPIRIEVQGNHMAVYVGADTTPILQATDANPLTQGAIGIGAGFAEDARGGVWEICFDNVRVTGW